MTGKLKERNRSPGDCSLFSWFAEVQGFLKFVKVNRIFEKKIEQDFDICQSVICSLRGKVRAAAT